MEILIKVANKPRRKIQIQQPTIRNADEERLWGEVAHYASLIPHEPDPNFSRVQEIKEELASGTYLTGEIIEETAARLAIRFMRPE